jgi:asparagine synthase (glutamine-hydrolysing)
LIQHRKQLYLAKTKQLILAANVRIYNHRALRKQFEGNTTFQVIAKLFGTLQRKGPHFIDEMNGILVLPFMMSRKMNTSLQGITWGLFHYTSVGMSTVRFMLPELKALEGYCTKIQLFPGHLDDEY